jgi:hypothetical protein
MIGLVFRVMVGLALVLGLVSKYVGAVTRFFHDSAALI